MGTKLLFVLRTQMFGYIIALVVTDAADHNSVLR